MPIRILVSHLLQRDGNFVVLMHVPHVVMAVLIYLYMMNSVRYLQYGLVHGLPMRELIQACAMFFLIQRILEIPTLIMFARPLNIIKQISIAIDLLLVAVTMIFMNDEDRLLDERLKIFEERPYL